MRLHKSRSFYAFWKGLAFFITLFLLTSCEPRSDNDPWFNYSFLCQLSINLNKQEDKVIEDAGPYLVLASYIEDFPSCSYRIIKTWTLKKCLQGQVYREQENDCKGTGSAADLWGAQTFPYCPTNDTACETQQTTDYGATLFYADPAKSPAAASCDGESIADKKWSLPQEWSTANDALLLTRIMHKK